MTSARRAGTVFVVLVALVVSASAASTTSTTSTSTTRKPSATTTTSRPATTTTTSGAEAARQAAIDAQIRTLREQVEEASAAEAAVLDRVDEVAAKRRSLEGQVRALDAEVAAVEADLANATALLDTINNDLIRAETKLTATSDDLDLARAELTDRAVNAYIRQPGAQLATVLLERQSFRELAAATDFLRSIFDAQHRSVGRYRSLQESIAGERRSLGELRNQAAAQRALVEVRRTGLLASRGQRDGLRAQAQSEEARQKTLLAAVKTQVERFEAEIASLKKESDAIAALLRSRQRTQKATPSGKGVLAAPVPGRVTSAFGSRLHPLFETVRMHNGLDLAGADGTPVKSAEAGTVAVAGTRGAYGTTVIVDHENGVATLYAHLSGLAVGEGAKVARGDVVGYVGSSGFSTGPHLHFEVRVNGNPVDPMRYL